MTVEDRYRDRGLQRGREVYLDAGTAAEYVRDCENENVAILGIEGFLLRGDDLIPQMDLICDFSPRDSSLGWEQYRAQVNRDALTFLNGVNDRDALVFEFEVLVPEQYRYK